VKALTLDLIRETHLQFFSRELPERIAIYFHELERAHMSAFREAMEHFQALGYRTCNAYEFAAQGAGEKLLFISFDDNFRNWHTCLDAIAECGVTCTFYTNTGPFRDVACRTTIEDYFDRIGYAGDRQTLSRAELRAIAEAGHTIGCHTHNHPVLSSLPRSEWDSEILLSKRILEDVVGSAVVDFSYPFGMRRHFSEDLRAYCAEAGFATIATGLSGQHHAPTVDPLNIHRTGWKFELDLEQNVANLKIDARIYGGLFGRSATC
jgi:peptidoglycan/xylan/chitin deacetylase (PgdA/CDA1 family)